MIDQMAQLCYTVAAQTNAGRFAFKRQPVIVSYPLIWAERPPCADVLRPACSSEQRPAAHRGRFAMLRITIGYFMDQEVIELEVANEDYCIYVVHHDGVVFYVGQSSNVFNRLWQHLGPEAHGYFGGFGRGTTDLGRFIIANLPESREWTIDFLTLKDCGRYTVFQVSTLGIDAAEADLIRVLRPCLNRSLNQVFRDNRLKKYKSPWKKVPAELWPF
jgi:hypothetical protein